MKWEAKVLTHRGEKFIAVYFEHSEELNQRIRQLPGAKWSRTQKAWLLPDTDEYRVRFRIVPAAILPLKQENILTPENIRIDNKESFLPPENSAIETGSVLNAEWFEDYMRRLKLKGYSPNTIRVYQSLIIQFASYFQAISLEELTKKDVEKYLLHLHDDRKLSPSGLNSTVSAIKFLYENVWEKPRAYYDYPRAKRPEQLPRLIDENQLVKLFESIENPKHRLLLFMAYSAGLRVSEVVNLKLTDIHRKSMQLRIEQGKGKKDRMVVLSQRLLEFLETYYTNYHPKFWLFEGQHDMPLSSRSVQYVFERAKKATGITIKGGIHLPRHSFATHMLEQGIDIRMIQDQLGHDSIRTTIKYTHVSDERKKKLRSPFDNLKF